MDTLKRGSSAKQRLKILPRNIERSVVLHLLISHRMLIIIFVTDQRLQ